MRTAVVILFLGVVVGAFLFYVRGIGVQPATSAPQTIERQCVARTYAWTQKAEMPTPRTEVTASVLHGKVYVIGGFDGFARTLATVEVYDPATASWHDGTPLTANMPGRKMSPAAVVDATLRAIERGRDEVFVGQVRYLPWLMRLAPGLAAHLVANS